MLDLASGSIVAVERGPDWLFVRLGKPVHPGQHDPSLKESLWALLQEHFTYRLVLEMDAIDRLDRELVDQLVSLSQEIARNGGLLRLCGLSSRNQKVLQRRHLDDQFPTYGSRMDAVLCRGDSCIICKPR